MTDTISKAPRGRVKRTPLGKRSKLGVEGLDTDKYYYRFINDVDDRISQAQAAGYEHVPASEVQIGTRRVKDASQTIGTTSEISVGGGMKSFLMRLPKEWREEDLKERASYLKQREAGLKRPDLEGAYGNIEISN